MDSAIQNKIKSLTLEDDSADSNQVLDTHSINKLPLVSNFDQSCISSKGCYNSLSNNSWVTTGQFWSIKSYGTSQTDRIYSSFSASWTDLSFQNQNSKIFKKINYFKDSSLHNLTLDSADNWNYHKGKMRPSKLNALQLTYS